MRGVRCFLYACCHGKLEIYLLVQAIMNKVPKLEEVSDYRCQREGVLRDRAKARFFFATIGKKSAGVLREREKNSLKKNS